MTKPRTAPWPERIGRVPQVGRIAWDHPDKTKQRIMSKKQIEECVRGSLEGYFQDLRGTEPDGMYDMLVRVVEKPLLEVVMAQAENNQSRAAQWLGMNRNTLRKKLVEHRLIK